MLFQTINYPLNSLWNKFHSISIHTIYSIHLDLTFTCPSSPLQLSCSFISHIQIRTQFIHRWITTIHLSLSIYKSVVVVEVTPATSRAEQAKAWRKSRFHQFRPTRRFSSLAVAQSSSTGSSLCLPACFCLLQLLLSLLKHRNATS